MRRPWLAANWKMYKTVPESLAYAQELWHLLSDIKGWDQALDLAIFPNALALWPFAEKWAATAIGIGAQNLDPGTEGALTGGTSGFLLREAGARFVIVGHSERRKYFGETDEIVRTKTEAALEAGLGPIVCVGESQDERRQGETLKVVHRQVRQAIETLEPSHVRRVTIAYEPVWAIGSGLVPTPEEVARVAEAIRADVADLAGSEARDQIRILYGGSVNDQNLLSFFDTPDVDGALIGGAALNAANLAKMARRIMDRDPLMKSGQ